jgi:molecular chaperone GrpE
VNERHVDGTDPAGVETEVSAPAGNTGDTVEKTDPVEQRSEERRSKEQRSEEEERPSVVVRDKRKVRDPGRPVPETASEPASEPEPEPVAVEADRSPGPLGAELAALRGDVDELTRDLQRITAEYANYRKRVERDRALVGEQAPGRVLAALLPVLDDIDRARDHDDLVGPFGSVAEQLINSLTKFGLTPFGEKGDPFDPTRHEAVAHQTSAEVTEPTCVGILRRGYLLNDRLLRPALVAVADPE